MFENLTAEQLLQNLTNGDYTVILLNLAAFVAGLVMHVWHKMRSEAISFQDYWTKYGVNSWASVIALVTTFASMVMLAPDAPLYAYFSMAYMGDALLNKPPVNLTRQRGLSGKLENAVNTVVELEKTEPAKVWGAAIIFVVVVFIVLAA